MSARIVEDQINEICLRKGDLTHAESLTNTLEINYSRYATIFQPVCEASQGHFLWLLHVSQLSVKTVYVPDYI
jgi:hypothetical protein